MDHALPDQFDLAVAQAVNAADDLQLALSTAAALRIGVADFSFATLSITFRRVAFASMSPG